jgi:hypothetical protein
VYLPQLVSMKTSHLLGRHTIQLQAIGKLAVANQATTGC